ncbi:uncharacterized protein LOC113289214 isoform X1 [Papaver somniferum]|uniref:uncharacterized protein LOC113289214 isoform X1 n=1 Tax=Papaver somniferum TaxID=3469 RepID=UPI000E6FEF3D|nr:uncharacterized protein LOC113289214 isoform X1 [Papaver somniferum]
MILSTMQEATIQEMLEYNQENSWNFVFSRNLKDEEIEDVAHSLDLISIFRRGDAEDYKVWQNGNKSFSVKECYKDLEVQGLIYFPYKCVWNPKIPQKRALVLFVVRLQSPMGVSRVSQRHKLGVEKKERFKVQFEAKGLGHYSICYMMGSMVGKKCQGIQWEVQNFR